MSRYKLEFYEFVGCVVFQDTRYAEDQKNPETYLTANEACDLLNELKAELEAAETFISAFRRLSAFGEVTYSKYLRVEADEAIAAWKSFNEAAESWKELQRSQGDE